MGEEALTNREKGHASVYHPKAYFYFKKYFLRIKVSENTSGFSSEFTNLIRLIFMQTVPVSFQKGL